MYAAATEMQLFICMPQSCVTTAATSAADVHMHVWSRGIDAAVHAHAAKMRHYTSD
jgi:hypothetical protein